MRAAEFSAKLIIVKRIRASHVETNLVNLFYILYNILIEISRAFMRTLPFVIINKNDMQITYSA